jgi:hypothetical protein
LIDVWSFSVSTRHTGFRNVFENLQQKKSAMNKLALLTSLASIGFLVNPASAVVLTNGGFESGNLTGWSGNFLGTTVGAPGVGAFEGSFAAKLEGPGGVAEVNQLFAVNPGNIVNMSGYLLTENVIPGGPSFGLFKIVFKNLANGDVPFDPALITKGVYNAGFPGAESLVNVNSGTAINTWTFAEVEVQAPAEAVSVQFLALNVDFAGGNNPVWFDGIQATIVPEPASVTMAGLGVLGLLIRRRRKS